MAALAGAGGHAGADTARPAADESKNPCHGPDAAELLCPDFEMAPPSEIRLTRTPNRLLLRARNVLESEGDGPVELRGYRSGKSTMKARQQIHRRDGSKLSVRTGAHLGFKFVPERGRFWKFRHAAQFELWRLDKKGRRTKRVRVGPKVYYCLRDLERVYPGKNSPKERVYPACNQNRGQQRVTLGTSVGWADIYGSRYPDQWINVKGVRRGCYAYVHIADPRNGIYELSEENNEAQTVVRLPFTGKLGRCAGLPIPKKDGDAGHPEDYAY